MNRERYRHGAHTVTELKYHFVWKTKYSYPVLRGEVGLRLRQILREVCVKQDMTIIEGNIRQKSCSRLSQCSNASIACNDGAIPQWTKFVPIAARVS